MEDVYAAAIVGFVTPFVLDMVLIWVLPMLPQRIQELLKH
jgi:hypothetical protein